MLRAAFYGHRPAIDSSKIYYVSLWLSLHVVYQLRGASSLSFPRFKIQRSRSRRSTLILLTFFAFYDHLLRSGRANSNETVGFRALTDLPGTVLLLLPI
jgi:hypothetical protein